MSGEGRSPKRQRLGSFSPASPPITANSKPPSENSQPQTPPPSVRMSPSWSHQGQMLPGLGYQGLSSPNTASSQAVQSQAVSNGTGSATEGEQQTETPVTTVGDVEMREAGASEGAETSHNDAENRRTDHERKDEAGVGVLYKLPTKPIPPLEPPLAMDVLSIYNLKPLQQSVARRDPVTGEKINVLRKSYTNKVKQLGLEGAPDAVKGSNSVPGLVHPLWDVVAADGTTTWQQQRGELMLDENDVSSMLGMLDDAMVGMKAGRLPEPEHGKWKRYLGLDETAATVAAPAKPLQHPPNGPTAFASKTGPDFLTRTAPVATIRNSVPASPRNANGPGVQPARPGRTGSKRRYDEGSWEGYDENGYDSPAMDDAGRRGSGAGAGKRQKRKVSGRQVGYYAQESF